MSDGEKYKLREAMAICAEASKRASQRGVNFSSEQALVYTTICLTMYWVMAVLGVEPQSEMYKRFEEVLANAKRFGIEYRDPDRK